MNRIIRIAIIVVGVGLILVIGYFFIARSLINSGAISLPGGADPVEEVPEKTDYQLIAEHPEEDLLVIGVNEQVPLDTPELYISSFSDATVATMNHKIAAIYSNFVTAANTWFTASGDSIMQHTFNSSTTISNLPFRVVRSPQEIRNGIAASADASQLAWITRQDNHHEVVLFDVASTSAQLIFGAEEATNFHSLTWAPSGQELAMVNGDQAVVMIDRNGVQNFNPIQFPFSQVNYLEWIETDLLAAVVTSQVDNPTPFAPKIVVFNRRGEVVEEHPIISNVGVPRVLWANDGLRFTYYNPWKNQFVVYNRFDQLQHVVELQRSGSFAPFGWTTGTTPPAIPNATENEAELDFSSLFSDEGNDSSGETTPFDVTADEWEALNLIHQDVMNQFKVDADSYRFAITDSGTELAFTLKKQQRPEQAFVQIPLQLLFLLPDLPAVSLTITLPDGTIISHKNFTRDDAAAVTAQFTTVEFANLFVITPEEPLGNPAHKTEVPEHTYLGDLLYSNTGEFNPYPAIGFMGATLNESEKMVWRDNFSVVYPTHWLERDLGTTAPDTFQAGDTLFYTGDTEFRSNSSWEGFGVSVRQFSVPAEVSLEQWAQVNRSDLGLELLELELHDPLQAGHLITEDSATDEYILKAGERIYSISYTNTEPISEADSAALQRILNTFSDHAVFQRDTSETLIN